MYFKHLELNMSERMQGWRSIVYNLEKIENQFVCSVWFLLQCCIRDYSLKAWTIRILYLRASILRGGTVFVVVAQTLSVFFPCFSSMASVVSAAVLLNKETVKTLQILLRKITGDHPRDPKFILGHAHTSRLLRLLESSERQLIQGSQ